MPEILTLHVTERVGDTVYQLLQADGEPYKIRTAWAYLNFQTFLYHWPCHDGGTSLQIPLSDSELEREVMRVEAFVAKKPALTPDGPKQSYRPIMIDVGEWLLSAWQEEPLGNLLGWIRFEIDLSNVVTGPTEGSPRTTRIVPMVDIQFLPV